jgi:hypothetical protein
VRPEEMTQSSRGTEEIVRRGNAKCSSGGVWSDEETPTPRRVTQISARRCKKTIIGLIAKMGLKGYDVGTADNARVVEGLTSILIRLNIRHKVKGAGICLTGLPQ